MVKQGKNILKLVAWFTGVVVSLVVGYGMIEKVLRLPWWLGGEAAPEIAVIVGWIVIVTTLIGVLLTLIRRIFKTNKK